MGSGEREGQIRALLKPLRNQEVLMLHLLISWA